MGTKIKILEGLTPKQKIYVMSVVEKPEMSQEDRAALLGIPVKTLLTNYINNDKLNDCLSKLWTDNLNSMIPMALIKFQEMVKSGDRQAVILLVGNLMKRSEALNSPIEDVDKVETKEEKEEEVEFDVIEKYGV